jgi:hypothetical protein
MLYSFFPQLAAMKTFHVEPNTDFKTYFCWLQLASYQLSRLLLGTYPAQKSIAITAITLHKLAQAVLSLSGLFDDDSDAAASLRTRAAAIEDYRDHWLKRSRTV